MSDDIVISVENLSKSYLVGHQGPQERYHSLRDTIVRHGRNYARKAVDMVRGRQIIQGDSVEEFWALKDVSFEVKRGEVLGIIGRNGAGKSTLLKILSRITEPTSGRVVLDGRVASLLEVGTGFHPELTGRENIFLNGAILGMTKVEIRQKFDEIVDFAEVDKFLDTPVKRYSSGMYVRLAFAVAAHLEPEILIVDEVLAVGDAEFQKKCLGKMKDVAGHGRTVLFVSHNMKAVQLLCQQGMVLDRGLMKCLSTVEESLRSYSESTEINHHVEFEVDHGRPSISFVSLDSSQLEEGTLVVEIGFKSPFILSPPVGGLIVSSSIGTPVFGSNPRFHRTGFGQPKLDNGVLRFVARKLPIHGGIYKLSVWLGDWQTDYDDKRDILAFEFKRGHPSGTTPNPETIGFVDSDASWSII